MALSTWSPERGQLLALCLRAVCFLPNPSSVCQGAATPQCVQGYSPPATVCAAPPQCVQGRRLR